MRKRTEEGTAKYREAITNKTYFTGGGCLMYLVSGRKIG
jgi:hypothetical protein